MPTNMIRGSADAAAVPSQSDAIVGDAFAEVDGGQQQRAAKRAKVVQAPVTTHSRLVSDASSFFLSDSEESSLASVSTDSSSSVVGSGGTTDAAGIDPPPNATPTARQQPLRPPLRFNFSGYSIWLDMERVPHRRAQDGGATKNDLEAAIAYAAELNAVHPIPAPHVTVIYGIDHLAEDDVRERFGTMQSLVANMGGWPDLLAKGVLVDKEYDGVDGGTMSMAWMEVTLGTSVEHEALIDAVHGVYHREGDFSDDGGGDDDAGAGDDGTATANASPPPTTARSGPWKPHLSICYDNPEESPLSLLGAMDVISKFPALLGGGEGSGGGGGGKKRPVGMSLWRTEGTMDMWRCLDRFEFQ